MLEASALLVARLAFGLGLSAHGAQKLFGWFGGYGLNATAPFFAQLGFHPPRALTGPGTFSLDALFGFELWSPLFAAVALAIGVIGAIGNLLARRAPRAAA